MSTRHLIAPELLPGLEFFPDMDFSVGLDAIRGGFGERMSPPRAVPPHWRC